MGLYKNQNGVLIPIAGRGKAEYGASAMQSGVITVNGNGSSSLITVNVTFSTPMPDGDYLVFINPNTAAWEKTQWRTLNNTANGFRFDATTVDGSAFSSVAKYNYTAFKLYTDNEYNSLLELPDTKLDKSVVGVTSSSDLVNKMLAMPSRSHLYLWVGGYDVSIDSIVFPRYSFWDMYRDYAGSLCFVGNGVCIYNGRRNLIFSAGCSDGVNLLNPRMTETRYNSIENGTSSNVPEVTWTRSGNVVHVAIYGYTGTGQNVSAAGIPKCAKYALAFLCKSNTQAVGGAVQINAGDTSAYLFGITSGISVFGSIEYITSDP